MIKVIFFDLDDTLLWDKKSVQTAFDETCRYAAEQTGTPCAGLEQAVREEATDLYAGYDTYEFTRMIGINPFEGLWGSFDDEGTDFQQMKEIVPAYRRDAWTRGLARIGIDRPELGAELADHFIAARKRNPFVYEESFEVLAALKEHYSLLLLTNGSPSLQQTKLTITPEIAPYFDHIIVSGGFGKGKPDASIFLHALETAGASADEVLMVGDNLMTDILGAGRAGIRSVWINREEKTVTGPAEPTFEIQHLSQLLPLLDELNATNKK